MYDDEHHEEVADIITYKWGASGGTPRSGNGGSFTWKAPAPSGNQKNQKFTVTFTVDNGNDTNKGDNTAGTRDDKPVSFSFDVRVSVIPDGQSFGVPVNLRHDPTQPEVGAPDAVKAVLGEIHIHYWWDSSTGKKSPQDLPLIDLGFITFREVVTYQGGTHKKSADGTPFLSPLFPLPKMRGPIQ